MSYMSYIYIKIYNVKITILIISYKIKFSQLGTILCKNLTKATMTKHLCSTLVSMYIMILTNSILILTNLKVTFN